jgi:predicted amidohydrolase
MPRIGLVALKPSRSVPRGVATVQHMLAACRAQGVQIACFPETYLPGLRGCDEVLPPPDQPQMEWALQQVSDGCRETGVAAIVGMEWVSERGLENRAFVIDGDGTVLGHQTKNQITPGGEEKHYVPDGRRRLFRIGETVFGIVICHEGWRYPETVRWAAVRGAQVVFQPQWTGSDHRGRTLERWGEAFYEKAMQCRAQENTVYFASVNHALRFQNSATSLIDPQGHLVGHVPYAQEEILVADLDLTKATRFYAERFRPEW